MRALINIDVPKDGEGNYLTNQQLRVLIDKLGQRPTDMPFNAKKATGSPENEGAEEAIREYCAKKAAHIIERLPMNYDYHTHNEQEEERLTERKEFARRNIFYAGTLTDSGADFMVTRESNGIIRIRLLHQKIEDLQAGCVDLFRLIQRLNRRPIRRILSRGSEGDGTWFEFKVSDTIRIFEHGLEESTISGVVVKGVRRRWRYLRSRAGLEIGLALFGLIAFGFCFAILQADVLASEDIWRGQIERISTAMATTAIVSSISVTSAMARKPIIQWTASYDRNRKA